MSAIRKLLVANRGEIARRVFRTCRDLGIATVAVYSDPDRHEPFVLEADEAVAIGGAAPAESYLRIDSMLDAARRVGADAVHPGYGFLAESPAFAQACVDARLVFIGPSADAIAVMGSKTAARDLARRAGVRVLPGADLASLDHAGRQEAAERLGFPVLVKAVAGGGGRGMRRVSGPGELDEAVASATREAAAAFGDGAVFLEKWLDAARHVEVQVFGDAHGNVVPLFERECSIQRRHQKVIEEAPSPAVDARARRWLGEAAAAAARAVGYVGAGTVEFLLDASGGFYFLEMNTRLQVEHPVTECVTGLDLVALQIRVAEGHPLPAAALAPTLQGHAIEARLYAEDPQRGFAPETGTLHRFEAAAAEGVRLDAGVGEGSQIGIHYDPLLAKVIAHAPSRSEAAARLARALAHLRIHGVATNRDLLVAVLRHPEFLEGRIDTAFLERHPPAVLAPPAPGREGEALHAVAAALTAVAQRRRDSVMAFAPPGWRNNPSAPAETTFEGAFGARRVAYAWRRDGLHLAVDGHELAAHVRSFEPERVILETDGVQRKFDVHRVADVAYVDSPLGHSRLVEAPRFPALAAQVESGSLRAPLPGVVTRVAARTGEELAAGALVAVIEAMKMEHRVTTPSGGRVAEVRVQEGETVVAGAVLARIDPGGPGVAA